MKNRRFWMAARMILGVSALVLIIISILDESSKGCLAAGLFMIAAANMICCADRRKKANGSDRAAE